MEEMYGNFDAPHAYEEQEFRERKWEVACFICGAVSKETEPALEAMGWALLSSGEYCPSH